MTNYQQLTQTLLNGLNSQYQQKREIVSVNGFPEAKAYSLERGENVILMDSNSDIIYVKSCDDVGKCTTRVYKCEEVTDSYSCEVSDTISKNDFKKLSDEVAELKTMLKGVVNEHNAKQSKRNETQV